jgi:hypothetical protein
MEIVNNVRFLIVKNLSWIMLALIALFFAWLNPVLFLEYVRVTKWPIVIFVLLYYFKKEVSVLVTEKLKSFLIKALGVEFQGSLADQNNQIDKIAASKELPDELVQEKFTNYRNRKKCYYSLLIVSVRVWQSRKLKSTLSAFITEYSGVSFYCSRI